MYLLKEKYGNFPWKLCVSFHSIADCMILDLESWSVLDHPITLAKECVTVLSTRDSLANLTTTALHQSLAALDLIVHFTLVE